MKNTPRNIISYWIYLWLFCVLCVTSCQQEESPVTHEEVTVEVCLGSPDCVLETRGVSDDPKNANGSWTTEELLVDGSHLYRVTLLLVDGNNRLVGIKDWNDDIKTTLPTEVSTTFKGVKPKTTYRMIAVANYSAYGTSWNGLSGFPNLANLTVGNDISATISALNSYTLPAAGSDCIAAKQPQPLSLVQEFMTPSSGTIQVGGELLRTYARIRIEIANRSESYELSVNSLKFGSSDSKFGTQSTPLMQVEDAQIPASIGNLIESSTDAITPFAALTVPTLNDEVGNTKVAFDGYIYECKNTDTNGFEYSLNVGYPIVTTTIKTVYKKGEGTTYPSTGLYMIGKNNDYLTSNGNGVDVTKNTEVYLDLEQDKSVIWQVINYGSYCIIKTYGTGKSMSVVYGGIVLNDYTSYLYLNGNKIRGYYSSYNGYNYLYYYVNMLQNNVTVTDNIDQATAFTFYPLSETTIEVSGGEGSSNKNVTIPLETLINGVPQKTSIIRRNDFINVLVTVSYNEDYNTIDFHVSDWNAKNGDIEFN